MSDIKSTVFPTGAPRDSMLDVHNNNLFAVDIVRTAIDIILLRPPNFTDYWNHTSLLRLLDPYYNLARQSIHFGNMIP